MLTLFHKVWDRHAVRTLASGQTQLFVGLHLIHEVTSPQAFDMLRQHNWRVAFPERTFATVDHIVPTKVQTRPFLDVMAEEMMVALERNCREYGISLWSLGEGREHQGIVHVIGPELGLTQPGMTIACGDSHTSTHGALGAIAFGIGTSQVRDVLASQCLALDPLKVRRIDVNGTLPTGVYAKDVILTIIRRLGRLRVRRLDHRPHDNRRADDDLQHVDRRRGPGRLRESGRDDLQVPQRAQVCSARRRVRPCRRVVAEPGV
jgi:3-isopropylmalate/(R)-2-methylmalate dehydratase large subunit